MNKFIRSVDKNYIEITGEWRAETDRAIRINDGTKDVWLPKSQLENIEMDGFIVTITMPEWLAHDKELI